MRSLKTCLVLGLIILMIGFFSSCKGLKNIFGSDNEKEFAYNVEIIYEREASLEGSPRDPMYLTIYPVDTDVWEYWGALQNVSANEIAKDKYKYIAKKLPANVRLYVLAQETEFTGKTFIINGVELTDIGKYTVGSPFTVAYFTIKPDGTVIP